MADLRGEQLKDSYQNLVTRGTGNKLENGNGVEFADLDDKASLSSLTLDLSTDANFSAGILELRKVEVGGLSVITIMATTTPEHSSTSSAGTAEGFLPNDWRPITRARNIYIFGPAQLFLMTVRVSGQVGFSYRDYDGVASERLNASQPSITYISG